MANIHNYLSLSSAAQTVNSIYISPDEFADNFSKISDFEKISYLRFFLVNNVPFAFRVKPLVFEQITQYISDKLRIPTNDVKLIGSAKIGFSMGKEKYGNPFGANSDLDFAIINEDLFNRLSGEFQTWRKLFTDGIISARNSTEQMYWSQNMSTIPHQLEYGFIDSNKIPNRKPFELTREMNQTLWLIGDRLGKMHSISVKKASVRVYRNWAVFSNRIRYNTNIMLQHRNKDNK